MADYGALAEGVQSAGPAQFEHTDASTQEGLVQEADKLFDAAGGDPAFLIAMREFLCEDKDKFSFFTHLAACNALSKAILGKVTEPVHVSVCFAVYGETNRIYASDPAFSTEWVGVHENGEDFLRNKVKQLDWVTTITDGMVTWSIMVCDDGCSNEWELPNGTKGKSSGKIIETIAAKECQGKDISVVYLADGIDNGHPVCAGMTSPKDSRKGGAIHYAMQKAIEKFDTSPKKAVHVVSYTDADLSTHLGQLGLLVDPILKGAVCGVGSRRHSLSVMVKTGTRNVRGVVNAFLWKQLLPEVSHIVDTQTAFKGYESEICKKLLEPAPVERAFGFDLELLVKAYLCGGGVKTALENVAICWQDSEAESQSGSASGGDAYVKLLQGFATIYRGAAFPSDSHKEGIASFLDDLTAESWEKFLENCPEGIASKKATDFTPEYRAVTPEILRAAAGM